MPEYRITETAIYIVEGETLDDATRSFVEDENRDELLMEVVERHVEGQWEVQ